jgi:hypothetical protein
MCGMKGKQKGNEKGIKVFSCDEIKDKEEKNGVKSVHQDIGKMEPGGIQSPYFVVDEKSKQAERAPVMKVREIREREESAADGIDKMFEFFDPGVFNDQAEIIFKKIMAQAGEI